MSRQTKNVFPKQRLQRLICVWTAEGKVQCPAIKTPFLSLFFLVNKPPGEIIFKLNLLKWGFTKVFFFNFPKCESFNFIL